MYHRSSNYILTKGMNVYCLEMFQNNITVKSPLRKAEVTSL